MVFLLLFLPLLHRRPVCSLFCGLLLLGCELKLRFGPLRFLLCERESPFQLRRPTFCGLLVCQGRFGLLLRKLVCRCNSLFLFLLRLCCSCLLGARDCRIRELQ